MVCAGFVHISQESVISELFAFETIKPRTCRRRVFSARLRAKPAETRDACTSTRSTVPYGSRLTSSNPFPSPTVGRGLRKQTRRQVTRGLIRSTRGQINSTLLSVVIGPPARQMEAGA